MTRPVNAQLTFAARPPAGAEFESVIVVGQRANLASASDHLTSGFLPAGRCGEGLAAVAKGENDGVTKYVQGRDAVVATSSQASRHNTAERPDAVGSAVCDSLWRDGGKCPKTVLVVCVAREAASACVAIAAAVAQRLPTFSMRTGGDGGSRREDDPCAVTVVVTSATAAAGSGLAEVDAELVKRAQAVANEVRLAARLVDAPTNVMHTDAMVEEARAVAERVGAKLEVIRGEELRERGMGLIYGVGRAAEHPASLAVLTHGTGDKVVALVGKGIVYDTGGLSIKSKDGMPGMKRDMGGSAAVLGAFAAAVASGAVDRAGVTLHGVLCLAENAVDERATRPDDVHTGYSGLTVEINNTDAEGRLVLSDGCAFAAKDLKATHIVNIATLTGAQGIATGQNHAAIMSPTDGMERIALAAGKSTGNLCFPVLYAPEYTRDEFKSAIADMKNSVKARNNAQVSCAGQFIANHIAPFIKSGGHWVHIDCASPAFSKGTERASGFGVALLVDIVERIGKGEEQD